MFLRVVKKVLFGLLLFVLFLAVLVAYLSSGRLEEEEYTELITYKTRSTASDSTLKVMTYNLGYLSGMTNNRPIRREPDFFSSNLAAAKSLLQKVDADVIGVQEVDFGSSRSFYVNQLDTLARVADYASGYRSVNWDKKYVPFPYWPPSRHFGRMLSGQAIISNYALSSGQTLVLPPNRSSPSYYRAFYLDRLLQVTEFDYLGEKVKVLNVHLEAFDLDTRLRQVEVVKGVYEEYASNFPVILMGDFNAEIPAKSMDPDAIEALLTAPWIASAVPFGKEAENGTFPSDAPERMIDYIFYNENFLRCINAHVIIEAGQISDHLPVEAKFQLATP